MTTQLLHLDPSVVRRIAEQINEATEEIRSQTQLLTGLISQLNWSSPGRDQFVDEFLQFSRQINSLADEGDLLTTRVNNHVSRWEDAAAVVASSSVLQSVHEESVAVSRAGYEWVKPNERVVGNPVELEQYTEKQSGNTCALYAQGTAMRALGYSFNADETKKLGAEVGYYQVGPFDGSFGLGKVWDHYGVKYDSFSGSPLMPLGNFSSHDYENAGNFLIDNVSTNKAVIVGVEFDTLYNGIAGITDNYIPMQGHAVWVTGLVTNEQGSVTEVLLNDSIVGHSTRVPIENFMSAWGSKNFRAIASEEAIAF